jgi:hypothetical protein
MRRWQRLAACDISQPLLTAPEDGFLVFSNSAEHRLLVFALLINFDENKLGWQETWTVQFTEAGLIAAQSSNMTEELLSDNHLEF